MRVSRTIGEHSTHYANEPVSLFITNKKWRQTASLSVVSYDKAKEYCMVMYISGTSELIVSLFHDRYFQIKNLLIFPIFDFDQQTVAKQILVWINR